jgi:uncharacterized membrane protein
VTTSRLLAVVVALAVASGAFAGPATAAATTVEIQAATEEDATDQLFVTFDTQSNGTVSVPTQLNDGPAQFVFQGWERVGGPGSGDSSEWEAVPGAQYRVEYDAVVDGDAAAGSYAEQLIVEQEGTQIESRELRVDVDVLTPRFGSQGTVFPTVEVDQVREEPQDVTVSIPVENTGDGVMVLESVEANGLPSGIETDGDSFETNRLNPNERTDASLDLAVDPSVEAGTYEFTATVRDNLGNEEQVPVSLTVDELTPRFGTIDDPSVSVNVDRVGDGRATSDSVVVIPNTGEGALRLTDVVFEEGRDGVTATSSVEDTLVESGSTAQAPFTVSLPRNVSSGQYTLRGVAEDSTGASQQFETDIDVDVLFPSIGSISRQSEAVQFNRVGQDTRTQTFDVVVPNDGQGNMRLADVSVSGTPEGMTVTDTSVGGNVVDPGGQGTAQFDVQVDQSVSKGSYQFTATVEDTLGNRESFPVTVTVEKPPILGLSQPVSLGDVLVGTEADGAVEVAELGGETGIEGLDVSIESAPQNGSLSVDALRSTSVTAGTSTVQTLPVEVADDAPQHETLRWNVTVSPEDGRSVTRERTFTARVIYPPELANVSTEPQQFSFDRSRPTADYEQTATVTLDNAGDLPMTVTDVTASVDGPSSLSVQTESVPETVEGVSTGSFDVPLTATPETPEGNYTLTVTVETAEAGSQTITREVSVRHETELTLETDTVAFGELTITSEQTRAVDVTEELGYQSLDNFTVTRVDGPDSFLTVTNDPGESLGAGETDQIVFSLRFGTSAQVYRDYEWTFRIDGQRAEPRTLTVTARPSPYSFDSLRENVTAISESGDEAWREPVATGVVSTLDELEGQLRGEESIGRDTLPTALAMGRAALLYADAIEGTQAAQADGNYSRAQQRIVRAAVARDQLVTFSRGLPPSLQDTAAPTVTAANETLQTAVADQRAFYTNLTGSENTYADRARARRALAQLAAITGDRAAERENRTATRNATDAYLAFVSEASTHRADADAEWRQFRQNATVVLAGQPLVLNPARFDAATATLSEIDNGYAAAVDDYRTAGAESEADAVADRRTSVSDRATFVEYGLYGSLAIYALVSLAVLVRVSRRAIQYYRESAEAALGDFLLEESLS